ncbi:MAG: trk system potassium uptake protein TrkH, partial [Myxococcota bacterium]
FGIGFLALLASEPTLPFEALLFETMSALATVGVSTGITGELSAMGKLVVTFLMFVGRIGPLTLALAVGEPSRRLALQYPEGKIMVG